MPVVPPPFRVDSGFKVSKTSLSLSSESLVSEYVGYPRLHNEHFLIQFSLAMFAYR
jgi:hypothetical protein